MKKTLCIWLVWSAPFLRSQDTIPLNEITVTIYPGQKSLLRLPASVIKLDSMQGCQPGVQSGLPILNSVSGVRMEERSPGSYRLSVRGSLLRSPFGVRNTKVYLDECPLTNAGGETYLNLLDFNCLKSVEVQKGPDGSVFGANSCGVIRINPANLQNDSSFSGFSVYGGSYKTQGEYVNAQQRLNRSTMVLSQGWQQTAGYREHSSFDRKYMYLANRFRYKDGSLFRAFLLFSDLNYQTPGGLTLQQFTFAPEKARPSSGTIPGAKEQKAGVSNRTVMLGGVNDLIINRYTRHLISVSGSSTHFENPFLTNYEVRNENGGSIRSWIDITQIPHEHIELQLNAGGEFQFLKSLIQNYDNKKGIKDTLRITDHADVMRTSTFIKAAADLFRSVSMEAALSYNYDHLVFTRSYPDTGRLYKKTLPPQFMPRVAASWAIQKLFSIRAILSRGYSPASLQETRSSNNELNMAIQPESGWNYEIGGRMSIPEKELFLDVSAFYYQLVNAIVRRTNSLGQEYFINSGGTSQPGLEVQFHMKPIKQNSFRLIRQLKLNSAYTFYDFRFRNFNNGTSDISDRALTGVPPHVFVSTLHAALPYRTYFVIQYNYTHDLPLDDINSEYASNYHLLQAKAGWQFNTNKFSFDLCIGADNIFNEKYSLGNDLNAVGRRFYNAAPPRNYFAKLSLGF